MTQRRLTNSEQRFLKFIEEEQFKLAGYTYDDDIEEKLNEYELGINLKRENIREEKEIKMLSESKPVISKESIITSLMIMNRKTNFVVSRRILGQLFAPCCIRDDLDHICPKIGTHQCNVLEDGTFEYCCEDHFEEIKEETTFCDCCENFIHFNDSEQCGFELEKGTRPDIVLCKHCFKKTHTLEDENGVKCCTNCHPGIEKRETFYFHLKCARVSVSSDSSSSSDSDSDDE